MARSPAGILSADPDIGGSRPTPEKTAGDYSMCVGQGYRLKIKSTGRRECAIVAPQLLTAISLSERRREPIAVEERV